MIRLGILMHTPLHRILPVIDSGPAANCVLEHAVSMAKQFDAGLQIRVATHRAAESGDQSEEMENAPQRNQHVTDDLARRVPSNMRRLLGPNVESPGNTIEAYAVNHHIDLVVFGVTDQTGRCLYLLGGRSNGILHAALNCRASGEGEL